MRQKLTLLLFFFCLKLIVHGQNYNERDTLAGEWARQELKTALTDKTQHNVINPKLIILDSKSKAVKFAEQILFDIYGKEQIENEKPYDVCNINGYWVIAGTLPKSWEGGTFLIIIDSHNCKVIRITHGK